MGDNSDLLRQLAGRAKSFYKLTGVSQSMMAAAIGMEDSNYSAFLAGRKGLGAQSVCLLLKFTNMPRQQVIAKLTQSPITSKVMMLQEQGQSMQLDANDGGWVPGLSGTDPNASSTIDDTPDNETLDTLRSVRGVHRKIIRIINEYINAAKVNQGSTQPTDQKFSRR